MKLVVKTKNVEHGNEMLAFVGQGSQDMEDEDFVRIKYVLCVDDPMSKTNELHDLLDMIRPGDRVELLESLDDDIIRASIMLDKLRNLKVRLRELGL